MAGFQGLDCVKPAAGRTRNTRYLSQNAGRKAKQPVGYQRPEEKGGSREENAFFLPQNSESGGGGERWHVSERNCSQQKRENRTLVRNREGAAASGPEGCEGG